MSSSVTDLASHSTPTAEDASVASPKTNKGKGKAPTREEPMDEDDEEEEEEEEEDDEEGEEDEEEEEEEEEEDADEGIDPSAIVSGRRTRGVRVDYASQEALEKAGLKPGDADDDEDDDIDMH